MDRRRNTNFSSKKALSEFKPRPVTNYDEWKNVVVMSSVLEGWSMREPLILWVSSDKHCVVLDRGNLKLCVVETMNLASVEPIEGSVIGLSLSLAGRCILRRSEQDSSYVYFVYVKQSLNVSKCKVRTRMSQDSIKDELNWAKNKKETVKKIVQSDLVDLEQIKIIDQISLTKSPTPKQSKQPVLNRLHFSEEMNKARTKAAADDDIEIELSQSVIPCSILVPQSTENSYSITSVTPVKAKTELSLTPLMSNDSPLKLELIGSPSNIQTSDRINPRAVSTTSVIDYSMDW